VRKVFGFVLLASALVLGVLAVRALTRHDVQGGAREVGATMLGVALATAIFAIFTLRPRRR
jgi:uncharacterized membrane protein YgaE (UPF0421/DUF939 family)